MLDFLWNLIKGTLFVSTVTAITWGALYLLGPDMVAKIALGITGALILAAVGSTIE